MNIHRRSAWQFEMALAALTVISVFGFWILASHGAPVPDGTKALWDYGFPLILVGWVRADRRAGRSVFRSNSMLLCSLGRRWLFHITFTRRADGEDFYWHSPYGGYIPRRSWPRRSTSYEARGKTGRRGPSDRPTNSPPFAPGRRLRAKDGVPARATTSPEANGAALPSMCAGHGVPCPYGYTNKRDSSGRGHRVPRNDNA